MSLQSDRSYRPCGDRQVTKAKASSMATKRPRQGAVAEIKTMTFPQPALMQRSRTHRYHSTTAHVACELCGIGLALALTSWLLFRCFEGISLARELDGDRAGNSLLLILGGALFAGYLLADLCSGLVHFTFDRFFSVDTPLVGAHFVHPFRRHHSHPQDITLHGFIETNGNNCVAACAVLIPVALLPFDCTVGWQLFLVAVFVFASIGTFGTNQFHKWAHMQHPPALALWLQQKHLILPPGHHQLHHVFPYNDNYCITTGWINGFLSRIRFWRLLECVGQKAAHLPMFREETAWEQLPESPASPEREETTDLLAVTGLKRGVEASPYSFIHGNGL